jgi:hypothetical protein
LYYITYDYRFLIIGKYRPVRLAYQPPGSSTFLSEQTSHKPAVLFSQNKSAPVISHQPNEQAVYFDHKVNHIRFRLKIKKYSLFVRLINRQ